MPAAGVLGPVRHDGLPGLGEPAMDFFETAAISSGLLKSPFCHHFQLSTCCFFNPKIKKGTPPFTSCNVRSVYASGSLFLERDSVVEVLNPGLLPGTRLGELGSTRLGLGTRGSWGPTKPSCKWVAVPSFQLFAGFGFRSFKVRQPKTIGCRFLFPMEIHWASEQKGEVFLH